MTLHDIYADCQAAADEAIHDIRVGVMPTYESEDDYPSLPTAEYIEALEDVVKSQAYTVRLAEYGGVRRSTPTAKEDQRGRCSSAGQDEDQLGYGLVERGYRLR